MEVGCRVWSSRIPSLLPGAGGAGGSRLARLPPVASLPVAASLTFFLFASTTQLGSESSLCVPLALRCVMHCGGGGTATQKNNNKYNC